MTDTTAGQTHPAADQLRGSAVMLAAQLTTAAAAFVMTLAVARSLGPSGRGAYAFAVTVAVFISIFSHAGLSASLGFHGARYPWARRRLTALYVGTAAVTTLPLTILVWLAMRALTNTDAPAFDRPSDILVLAGLAFSSSLFDGTIGIQVAARRFRGAAVSSVLATALPAVYAIVAAAEGDLTVRGALLATAAGRVLVGAVGMLMVLRSTPARPADSEDLTSRAILDHSGRSFFAVLSGVLTARADQWVLGIMAGSAPLGIYAVAVSMSDPLQHVSGAAQRGYAPHIAVARGVGADLTERTIRGLLVALILGMIVLAPTALVLLPVVFGEAFTASRGPFLALLPGAFGLGLLAIYSVGLRSTGAPGQSSAVEITTGATMVALDLLLIGRFGATGAAVAATVAYSFGGGLAMYLYQRRADGGRWTAVIPRAADFARAARMAGRSVSFARGRRAAGRLDG